MSLRVWTLREVSDGGLAPDCLLIIAILVHSSSCKSTHSRAYNSGVDIPPSDAKISKVKK